MNLEICIDVPDLAEGVRFFGEAFGFSKVGEPYPGVAFLEAEGAKITLLEKREGTNPAPGAPAPRRYARHWTPVHLDFHVDDLDAALERAVRAGAVNERVLRNPEHGSLAICADPFGHGFCLLERRKRPER
ncbi:MAG TPA: VOC family protein [Minicystis sp.]|nr:VOC family protein [Minicystis sp.]